MPYSLQQLPAKTATGTTANLAAVDGGGIAPGTIAPVRADLGIGSADSAPVTATTLSAAPATPAGLVSLLKGLLLVVGDDDDQATASTIVGLLKAIKAGGGGGGGGGGGSITGIGDPADLPTSVSTLQVTPETASPLVSLCKAILINLGSSVGAVVTPATIAAATTTPYSVAFMIRTFTGTTGTIASVAGVPTDALTTRSGLASAPTSAQTLISLLKGIFMAFNPLHDAIGTTQDSAAAPTAPTSILSRLMGMHQNLNAAYTVLGDRSDSPASLSLLAMVGTVSETPISLLKAIGLKIQEFDLAKQAIGSATDLVPTNTTLNSPLSVVTISGMMRLLSIRAVNLDRFTRQLHEVGARPSHAFIEFNQNQMWFSPSSSSQSYSVSNNNRGTLISVDVINNSNTPVYLWIHGGLASNSTYGPYTLVAPPPNGSGLRNTTVNEIHVLSGPFIIPAFANIILGPDIFSITGLVFYGPVVITASSTFTTLTPIVNSGQFYARAKWIKYDTSF